MKRSDQPFVVGRRTQKGTTVVLLRGADRSVFPGPWTLRAVITPNQER
jgi:hypothetical protein